MVDTVTGRSASVLAGMAVIDCDIHVTVPSVQALFPYLAEHWREYITQSAFKGPAYTPYPKGAPTSALPDTAPPGGSPPGSDLGTVQQQVLDAWNVEIGILNCSYAVDSIKNPDAAMAMARAANDWLVAEWLDKEPRLRASIVVPSQNPEMAAEEIDRVGGHSGFVQVFLPVRSAMPYGNRHYHHIYAAAARHDLAISLQFGGAPGNPPTAAGWPSYYLEEYAGMADIFQTQLMSLIIEGVFDKFQTLRVALVESGFSWLPAFMWRYDKEWKGLRRETPWTKQPPSAYIHEHVRITLQPVDGPPDRERLLKLVDQLGSEEMLMFSTDYPHWHFDTPDQAIPAGLAEGLRRKILAENARAFYRLSR